MRKVTNIYKVMLALKEEYRNQFNLMEQFEDIISAKDELNAASPESSDPKNYMRMVLLKPHPLRLNLLLMDNGSEGKDFKAGHIRELSRLLIEEYNWGRDHETTLSSSKKISAANKAEPAQTSELFEIKTAVKIKPRECQSLIEKLQRSGRVYYDPADCETFLEEAGISEPRSFRRRGLYASCEETECQETFLTLAQALEELNKLRGVYELKNEIARIIALYEKIKKEGREEDIRTFCPYHFIFTYDNEGFGISTITRILTAIFYNLGIVKSPFYRELELTALRGIYGEENIAGLTTVKCGDTLNERKMAIDSRELCHLSEFFHSCSEDAVIIFAVPGDKNADKSKIEELFVNNATPYRTIHFPDLIAPHLVEICQEHLTKLGFRLCPEKEEELTGVIETLMTKKGAANLRLVDEVVNAVLTEQLEGYLPAENITEKVCVAAVDNRTNADIIIPAFRRLAGSKINEVSDAEVSPYRQLNDMIGLGTVKERIKGIIAHFIMEKKKGKAGIEGSSLCMHMRFAGNPGTGKTTVARIIGQILKEEGILKKGHMVEVGREGLVGAFVGHTALKTKRVIDDARGGVLFLDEAYSLQCDSKIDFGHEAVATLLKYMEDYREELMIILAGYPKEMDIMMSMNPGLADRVPHKIDFPDYSVEELYLIFRKLLGSGYILEDRAEEFIREILSGALKNSSKDFSNGRFVRNLIERLKLKQSQRLYELKNPGKKTLATIRFKDVEKLIEDEDMAQYLENPANTKIGFATGR